MDYSTKWAIVPVTSSALSLPHWTGTGLIKRNKLISTLPSCQMAQHRHVICRSLKPSTLLDLLSKLVPTRYLFRLSYWKIGRVSLTSSNHSSVRTKDQLSKDCLEYLQNFSVIQSILYLSVGSVRKVCLFGGCNYSCKTQVDSLLSGLPYTCDALVYFCIESFKQQPTCTVAYHGCIRFARDASVRRKFVTPPSRTLRARSDPRS